VVPTEVNKASPTGPVLDGGAGALLIDFTLFDPSVPSNGIVILLINSL
jgi:hypothetical protein